MRLLSLKSSDPGGAPFAGLTGRRGLAGALVLVTVLAACTGGSVPAPAASSAASTGAATSAAPSKAPSSAGASSNTAGNPADSCSVATKADVEAAFGGSSTDGQAGQYGVCTFDVSGKVKAGGPGDSPVGIRVFFDAKYVTYAAIKASIGDAVTQVDGLGAEAYYAASLGTFHVQVPGGMLTIGVKNKDTLDAGVLQQSVIDLAKAILARL